MKFVIGELEKKNRLDVFLSKKIDFSRSGIKNLIENGNVVVNGKTTKSGYELRENDEIDVNLPEIQEDEAKPENLPLDVVYEDEDLLVINKPQGMVVHAGNGNKTGTLVNALLFHIKDLSGINGVLRPGIVHRLDKNTSGLMLVAKNDKAHIELQRQIQTKECQRKYLAILEGNVKEDGGIIENFIGRNEKNRLIMAVVPESKGRKAITEFRVLERFPKNCLVEFNLKTGRTHQLRVHCKEVLHHSIVGDIEYGGKPSPLIFKNDEKSLGQYLIAYKISFFHPKTKKEMSFEIDVPNYFQTLLLKLRKTKE